MARYKATAKLYVDNALINAGQEFESDSEPGKKWQPLDKDAEAKVGSRPVEDRRGRPLPDLVQKQKEKDASAAAAADAAEKKAAQRADQKRATPGLSVAQQHSRGEEPTVDSIHGNEEAKAQSKR